MEKKEFLLSVPEKVHFFLNRREKDIALLSTGYNNFHFVKPQFFPRKQQYCTLHFVVGGKGTLNIEGKLFSVGKFQAFFLDTESSFAYYPVKEDPWEYVWFDFCGEKVKEYMQDIGFSKEHPVRNCVNPQKLAFDFANFFQNTEKQSAVSYFEGAALFYSLCAAAYGKKNNSGFLYENDTVELIRRFIEKKYLQDDFTVEYLSEAMHLSHSYLCKIFKEKTGMPVIAYLNKLRMERAEELLKSTELNAREIAYMSGYRDYEYFLKLFKKQHGITTSAFRKNL